MQDNDLPDEVPSMVEPDETFPVDISGNETTPRDISARQPDIILEQEQPVDDPKTDAADLVEIRALVEGIAGSIRALDRKFDNRLAQDQSKEKIIDTMHEELQVYRQDIGFKLILSLARSLIQLHDDVEDMMQVPLSTPATIAENNLRQALEHVTQTLRERLQAHGFSFYQLEDEEFDPKWQQSKKSIPTDNVDEDKTIAQRLSYGFVYGEKIIRPEIVSVFVYRENE